MTHVQTTFYLYKHYSINEIRNWLLEELFTVELFSRISIVMGHFMSQNAVCRTFFYWLLRQELFLSWKTALFLTIQIQCGKPMFSSFPKFLLDTKTCFSVNLIYFSLNFMRSALLNHEKFEDLFTHTKRTLKTNFCEIKITFIIVYSKIVSFLFAKICQSKLGCPRGVMVNTVDCWIEVSEFELQSHYYVQF